MSVENPRSAEPTIDPERWVDAYGDYLYRYALTRLRNPKAAEDMVQETFLAALKARTTFSGRSSEKTWFVGILKHKIIDHFRKSSHEQPMSDFLTDKDDNVEELFDREGRWKKPPAKWDTDPGKVIERDEFWVIFQNCLNKLQSKIADAFSLRELEGLETDEICEVLQVSKNNLWVMLHRARIQLRQCLENNWFGGGKSK
jgi:RNA polymerase sigma-70 factor, ECF subfamily